MPFITLPGLRGKVFVPEQRSPVARKHPCAGCLVCQGCSDDRCRLCRCGDCEPPGAGMGKATSRDDGR